MLTACSRDVPTPAETTRDGCPWGLPKAPVYALISGRLSTPWNGAQMTHDPEVPGAWLHRGRRKGKALRPARRPPCGGHGPAWAKPGPRRLGGARARSDTYRVGFVCLPGLPVAPQGPG
jgi:hypothetical protein